MGDQRRRRQRPGAPGGKESQGFPEDPLPVEEQIRQQGQGGEPFQPRAGERPLERLGQKVGPVSHRQPVNRQQNRRQSGKKQRPVPLAVGQPQQEQPPQQHRCQGGGSGGQPVIVGVGDGAGLVGGIIGEPQYGRHQRRV